MRGTLEIVSLIALTTNLHAVHASDDPSPTPEGQTYSIYSAEDFASDDSLTIPQYPRYSVYSKDVGWDGIDVLITEVEMKKSSSLFNVPKYSERTPMESRFAMCAFSQATLLRGFTHWVLSVRPAEDPNIVRVGFYIESPDDMANKSVLLPGGEKIPGAASFAGMCQFFDPNTGETSNKSLNPDASNPGAG